MEYSFEQWVNHVVHAHPLVASVVVEFSNWGVALFGVLAVGLWLLPPGDTRWKRAAQPASRRRRSGSSPTR